MTPRPTFLPPPLAAILCRCPRERFLDAVARLQPLLTVDLKPVFPELSDGEFAMLLVYLQAERAITYDGLRWSLVAPEPVEGNPAGRSAP